ncbi:hypothetical protein [Vagococcus jeotgali]|uniref:hypothetical protein n=1 Tax=Vagococcus jeotgali TaxID=3109030 RepID=UPI002DD8CDD0|nr:hypothetical protein [Vagococcus sp. B2T-5]
MNQQWGLEQIKILQEKEQVYEIDALLKELELILIEQYKRKEQLEGQLDGTLWSPNKW